MQTVKRNKQIEFLEKEIVRNAKIVEDNVQIRHFAI